MDDLFSPGFLAGLDRELNAGLANGPGDAHLPRAAWDAGGLPGFDQPEPVDGTADPLFAEDGSVVVFTQEDADANTDSDADFGSGCCLPTAAIFVSRRGASTR